MIGEVSATLPEESEAACGAVESCAREAMVEIGPVMLMWIISSPANKGLPGSAAVAAEDKESSSPPSNICDRLISCTSPMFV
jgi:hypothetical protein